MSIEWESFLQEWDGVVALTRKEWLMPVTGKGSPFYPPTYAGKANESIYNIDPPQPKDGPPILPNVCLVDSQGSQANRIEPMFMEEPFRVLVPQIEITATSGSESLQRNLLQLGHRLADAFARSSTGAPKITAAFKALLAGDAVPLAKLGPTSLVFGVWDSRDTFVKWPRIVNSVIRAYDVRVLTRSALYTPPVSYSDLGVFDAKEEAKEGNSKDPLSQAGFKHCPSTRALGGVIAEGDIVAESYLALGPLRNLRAADPTQQEKLRRYILGLALTAFFCPQESWLRQGCLLVSDPERAAETKIVRRDGTTSLLTEDEDGWWEFAQTAAAEFGVGASEHWTFDKRRAKELVAKAKKKNGKNKGNDE